MLLFNLGLCHHAEGRRDTRFNPKTFRVERVYYVKDLNLTVAYLCKFSQGRRSITELSSLRPPVALAFVIVFRKGLGGQG